MRVLRWATAVATVGATLLAPSSASANGGAYLDFGAAHHLPGDTVVAETYVSVPRNRQDLFDRGPFHGYLLTGDADIREGAPLPAGAIRLGTFEIEHDRGTSFELEMRFIVPDLEGALYEVRVCNDPCSLSGFREPITGTLSVVETEREGVLLTEVSRLQGRLFGARHDARKAERKVEELETELATSAARIDSLTATVDELQEDMDGEVGAPASAGDDRPLVNGWAAAGIGGTALLSLVAAILLRRRRHPAAST